MNTRTITLALLLFIFWLGLSGHYTGFLIGSGAVSAGLVAWISRRRGIVDRESVPLEVVIGALRYFPWLLVEIAKSAIAVARVVLRPRLQISPVMTVVDSGLKTEVGIATFANSITLTPGTVTCGVSGKRLVVYALVREGADDIEAGGMEARVRAMEGGA